MLARINKLELEDTTRLVCAEADVAIAEMQKENMPQDGRNQQSRERFDLVVSSLLLAHLELPEVTVGKAMGLLDPEGTACFLFFANDGAVMLRPWVRLFLWCLGGRPVDVQAVTMAMEQGGSGIRRGVVEERRSLCRCLVLLSIDRSEGTNVDRSGPR